MLSLLDELKPIDDDERVGFNSPLLVIGVIGVYLLFVLKIGPKLMKNREPYKLKELICAYNIVQVVFCIYIITRVWDLASWSIFDFSDCQNYLPNTVLGKKFNKLMYFTFWLKIFELLDTVLFVLRKKQKQITYLHVFHHSSMVILVHLILRYFRGKAALFPLYINSWVHVIMYTYYFFSNICSAEVMKQFIYVKKSITIVQMVQFCMAFVQAAFMWSKCELPLILRYYYLLAVFIIFYGFYDFYKKAYDNSPDKKLLNNNLKQKKT